MNDIATPPHQIPCVTARFKDSVLAKDEQARARKRKIAVETA